MTKSSLGKLGKIDCLLYLNINVRKLLKYYDYWIDDIWLIKNEY